MAVALLAALGACTADPANPARVTGAAPAAHGGTPTSPRMDATAGFTVSTGSGPASPTVGPATLTEPARQDLAAWAAAGVAVGLPVEVTLPGGAPKQGVVLQRAYPVPLPEGVTATLAYFDEKLGGWVAVPSVVSTDRRNVRATVTHLSLWTDFVGGTEAAMSTFTGGLRSAGGAVQDAAVVLGGTLGEVNDAMAKGLTSAADWTFYAVGKVFDVRVDPPSCTAGLPAWADSVSFIKTDRNNPILWCTGHDAKRPDLLVIKARVNRGFGFPVTVATPAAWTYNSTYDVNAFRAALDAVTELDKTVAESVTHLLSGGQQLVGPGQEVSFGFTEQAARSLPVGTPAVTLTVPSTVTFVASIIADLTVKDALLKAEGWVPTTIALAACARGIAETADPLTAARALLTCLTGADDNIARLVARARAAAKNPAAPEQAAASAGLVARISIYLALTGPTFRTMNYVAETKTLQAARTATIFPKTQTRTRTFDKTHTFSMTPFDSAGNIDRSLTVEDMRGQGVLDCQHDQGSPVAGQNTPDTHSCGTVADNTFACWEQPRQVGVLLCAFEPFSGKVVLRDAINVHPTSPPADPSPFAIELTDGSRWFYRVGGAWDPTPPGTIPAYGCQSQCPAGEPALLLSDTSPLIDKSSTVWTILRGQMGSNPGKLPKPQRVEIAKVWFLGPGS